MECNVVVGLFASTRYWPDAAELTQSAASIKSELAQFQADVVLITEPAQVEKLCNGRMLVAVPMSGAVQQMVLNAAARFDIVSVYPGYISGNFEGALCEKMLYRNAAPAVMDIYAVLKRKHPNVMLARTRAALDKQVAAACAYCAVQASKLLLIGETEPWVISSSRDLNAYRDKLGIEIIPVPHAELVTLFEETTAQEAEPYAHKWQSGAAEILEPTPEDILAASRAALALEKLIRSYNADGAAIACFNLLNPLATSSCLAVSHINNDTDWVAACEGDLDAAVTMLLMKKLAGGNLWMANPNLQQDDTVNFVHCTAPTEILGKACRYCLRNHHESGIGVSPQVEFEDNTIVTACRISDDASAITIQTGVGSKGTREPSCRTQFRVTFDDFDRYIRTALGCHQVFAFADIREEMQILAELLGLRVL